MSTTTIPTADELIAQADLPPTAAAFSWGDETVVIWLPDTEVSCYRSSCDGGWSGEPFVGDVGNGPEIFPRQCGCGETGSVPVSIVEVDRDTTVEIIEAAAQQLIDDIKRADQEATDENLEVLKIKLMKALVEFLGRIDDGEDLDEVRMDYESDEPGPFLDSSEIMAWTWDATADPEYGGDIIKVTASDLDAEGQALAQRVQGLLASSPAE